MATLSDFSAILFDVDMTLTTSQREVSPNTQAALSGLATKGIKLGVCTGRTYVSLVKPILPYFPDQSLHIVAGGSQIITKEGEVKWQQLLAEQIVREIVALADETGEMYYLANTQQGYGNQTFIETYQNLHSLIPPLRLINELKDWQIPAIVCVNVSQAFLEKLQQRQDITLKTSVSTGNFVSLDITPKGVTKEIGVREWCRLQEVEPHQVIGVGDSDNDIEFLKAVGYAVAMGNSTDQIRSVAHKTIGETDNDGLAVYLDGLVKGASV
ncbi:HAD family phosphatase [Patescibacteria group bacterium]|nr:HAD family phosphatase [Patescibacteria group bacterium]